MSLMRPEVARVVVSHPCLALSGCTSPAGATHR